MCIDILESGFELLLKKPVVVPPVDEELGLPQIEGPYPIPGGGVNPTNPADPGNEGITHVVKQGVKNHMRSQKILATRK